MTCRAQYTSQGRDTERNQRKETQMTNRGEKKDNVKRDKGFRSFI